MCDRLEDLCEAQAFSWRLLWLPITGYSLRWSHQPGPPIPFQGSFLYESIKSSTITCATLTTYIHAWAGHDYIVLAILMPSPIVLFVYLLCTCVYLSLYLSIYLPTYLPTYLPIYTGLQFTDCCSLSQWWTSTCPLHFSWAFHTLLGKMAGKTRGISYHVCTWSLRSAHLIMCRRDYD